MNVAVFGSRGQLGAAIVAEFRAAHDVAAFDHQAVDVADAAGVSTVIGRLKPDLIINCTGYNAVDAAEQFPVDAFRVNAFAVRTLAREAQAHGATLVHYGSDFVFDGTASTPYTEDAPLNPRSAYASSKMVGEWFALEAPRAYVLRVESLFGRAADGPPAKGSVEAIVRAIRAGDTAKVFFDRIVSPTFVIDAARATRELVERNAPAGVYHCVNTGHTTWLDLGQEIARLLGVEGRFEAVSVASVKLPAARPVYCALSNRKLADAAFEMPTWQDALKRYLAIM
jgi:dTDP-4-dehydrorhamnose reductase